jgi:hypothetical protein
MNGFAVFVVGIIVIVDGASRERNEPSSVDSQTIIYFSGQSSPRRERLATPTEPFTRDVRLESMESIYLYDEDEERKRTTTGSASYDLLEDTPLIGGNTRRFRVSMIAGGVGMILTAVAVLLVLYFKDKL